MADKCAESAQAWGINRNKHGEMPRLSRRMSPPLLIYLGILVQETLD